MKALAESLAHKATSIPAFDIQRFALDDFHPALQSIIEQQNYLERIFRERLMSETTVRNIADREPVPAAVGESITKTRPGLKAPVVTDAPAQSAGDLNNGMTPTNVAFEQYSVTIGKMKDTIDLSLELQEAQIAPQFELNVETNAEQAAQSLDWRCMLTLEQAYDSGNTYAIAPSTGTTVRVDNGFGLASAFSSVANTSPGLAAGVSALNPLKAYYLSATAPAGTLPTPILITGIAFDALTAGGANVSSQQAGNVAYGASAAITLAAALTVAVGDQIFAADGAVIYRPNGKNTRVSMTSTDTVQFQQFARARAKLVGRRVPRFTSTGMYVCLIDPTLYADILLDPKFDIATQGQFDRQPIFTTGVFSRALGMEFVECYSMPNYSLGNNLTARGAMVVGSGALVEAPFEGSLKAARKSNAGLGVSDIRIVNDIVMITRPALDREADTVSQTWRWTGGHVCPTDVTSNPTTIQTSDYSRFKRAVRVEAASSSY